MRDIRKKILLVIVLAAAILVSACTGPIRLPFGDESGLKIELPFPSAKDSKEDSGYEEEDVQTDHEDGDIYMYRGEKTIFISDLERCLAWIGKTCKEAGVPEEFETERWINLQGKIFGFPAHGTAYYDKENRINEVTIFVAKTNASANDIHEILVMCYGQAYKTDMEPYVEGNGGSVCTDLFAAGEHTIALVSAQGLSYSEIILKSDKPPVKELSDGQKGLQLIAKETGYHLTLPEDVYQNLSAGKVDGFDYDWYYINFTLDGDISCSVEILPEIDPEEIEDHYQFADEEIAQRQTQGDVEMQIIPEYNMGGIYWLERETTLWVISVSTSVPENKIDFNFLWQLRQGIIASWQQPE